MGVIKEFDTGNLALRPSETGVDATAMAARRVGTFFSQQAGAEDQLARETERLGAQTAELGSFKANLLTGEGARLGSALTAAGDAALKIEESREKTHGAAAYAGLLAQATTDWNNTVKDADPNDPTVAQRFMAGLEPKLKEFQDGGFLTEEGQNFAQAHVAALRQHFVEKTQADMSTLAAQAAHVNTQQMVNSLSATALNDPTSRDFALASLRSGVEGVLSSSPNISGPEAARVREELLQKGSESVVKSAAIGHIMRTAQVPDWISDPKYSPYVNGAELALFARQARTQAHYDQVAQKQAALLDRQMAEQQVHIETNKNFTDNVTFDPATNRFTIKPQFFQNQLDITRKYGGRAPDAAAVTRSYLDWGEAQQKEHAQPVVSDPAIKSQLLTDLFDPAKELTQTKVAIMKAGAEDKLAGHDLTAMRELADQLEQGPLKGPVMQDTLKAAHAALTYSMPGMPGKDPKGEQAYASFVQQFVPDYIKKSRAGTLPPDALNLNDPNSLISKSMAQFKRTPKQLLADRIEELGGLGGEKPKPLPALEERKAGQTYQTPRGPMKWTGTGWVTP